MSHSGYYDLDTVASGVAAGNHREIIGGLWDQLGQHQMAFLISQGLRPSDTLLDVGCGSLRLGALAIPWLDAGRYFGSDISAALIQAGRQQELDDAGRLKAPEANFDVNEDFSFAFLPTEIDVAVAQSVFTHLPLNHLRRCLAGLAPHMRQGGRFFVTYFECLPGQDLHAPLVQPPAGVTTFDYQDPYHYRASDLEWAVDGGPWTLDVIGDWDHPRGQRMAVFQRQ